MPFSFPQQTSFIEAPYKNFLSKFKELPNLVVVTTLAVLVGVGAGFGAIFTEWLVHAIQHAFFEEKLWGLLDWMGTFSLIVIPALGALVFGPIIIHSAKEARGHGVSEVLEAVAVCGGCIRPRVAVIKSITSAFCIGTGGSVGLEGPIAQIGAAVGSTIGQVFALTEERIRLLLGCGAGAAIAATFHAPITGTIFALEIILGHLEANYISAIVISAVVADTIAQSYSVPWLHMPQYALVSNWELLLYALLGVITAFAAIGLVKTMGLMSKFWKKAVPSEYLRPVVGGLVLGTIGFVTFQFEAFQADGLPRLYGIGYESINDALNGAIIFEAIFILFLFKIFTTSLTLGSGGTGGTFTPSLFMGAMLGGTFGYLVHGWFPELTAPSGAYALAGMAAFFGAAAHAPVTSIVVALELSKDYHLILPIMLTTVVGTLVAQSIHPNSMYTLKLRKMGIKERRGAPGHELYLMDSVTVSEAMNKDVKVVPLTMPLFQLMERFDQTHRSGFPVVDEVGDLAGIVSIKDLDFAMTSGKITGRTVADIATTDILVTYPYESMSTALHQLGIREISRLPVVEEEGSKKIVGMVLRTDIVKVYHQVTTERARQSAV